MYSLPVSLLCRLDQTGAYKQQQTPQSCDFQKYPSNSTGAGRGGMERYTVLDLIGEGSFGRVFRGRDRVTGVTVALKLIPKVGHSERELASLRTECKGSSLSPQLQIRIVLDKAIVELSHRFRKNLTTPTSSG